MSAATPDQFYVVNLSHHNRQSPYITFWRPDDKGYAWPLSWAGRYPREAIVASLDYYHNGHSNIAVACAAADALAVAPSPGTVDGNKGPVVLNTQANWRALLAAMIEPPAANPWPLWPGRRSEPKPKKAPHPREAHQHYERGG